MVDARKHLKGPIFAYFRASFILRIYNQYIYIYVLIPSYPVSYPSIPRKAWENNLKNDHKHFVCVCVEGHGVE